MEIKHPIQPVPIILDTDICPDCDDAGAVALLHVLSSKGEATILGMGCCTSNPWGAPCLDALNTYCGRSEIPVGTYKGEYLLGSKKGTTHSRRPDSKRITRCRVKGSAWEAGDGCLHFLPASAFLLQCATWFGSSGYEDGVERYGRNLLANRSGSISPAQMASAS